MISNQVIATIADGDVGLPTVQTSREKSVRAGARAVLFNGDNEVALVYETAYDHYKLPGGCVELSETLEQALRREIAEEVGATIRSIRYIGVVESHLARYNEDCSQHYFTAKIDGEIGKSAWIDEEELHGCSIVWCKDIAQAINKVQNATSQEYVHIFERARELAGLRYAEYILQRQNSTASSLGDTHSTL